MTQEDQQLIRRILRVNHAGEFGAIAIYTSQIRRAEKMASVHTAWLQETRRHEIGHRDTFFLAMPSRGAKPCRLMRVWNVGGGILGSLTGLFGDSGILACTSAVERTVHSHLEEQIAFLESRDPDLAGIVRTIQAEELEHLAYAEGSMEKTNFFSQCLEACISIATETLIAISTRGDSLTLAAKIRRKL